MARAREPATLTRVPGVRVGCAEDPEGSTGVTAVLFDRLSPTVVDVRGPASGTFDTSSLALEATFGRRDALFLSGGSVYGLDAARGLRSYLLSTGRGEPAFGSGLPIPRISGAVLYDLPSRRHAIPDYLPLGYAAAESASSAPVPPGRRGAGRGARVGKYAGRAASVPGGQGSTATALGGGHWLGLVLVLNSVGAVRDSATGRWLLGPADRRGHFLPPTPGPGRRGTARAAGTTLAIVVTDLPVDRRTLWVLAEHAHDGIARNIVPAHTATEGDTVFATSVASPAARPAQERRPGEIADRLSLVVEELVLRAVRGVGAAGSSNGES